MIKAETPVSENSRLASLEELELLPVIEEDSYNNITRLASFICKAPISLITFIGKDKQWFKAKVGTELCEADRDISHCSHAILNPDEILEVRDTREDSRFVNNPYTLAHPPLLFYAGMPIKSPDGIVLGTLCILDFEPRVLDNEQRSALQSLGQQVENLIALRRQNLHLEKMRSELKKRNSQLKDFAGTVSHDMKMPLANMIMTSDILRIKYGDKFDEQGKEYLAYLKKSSFKLSNYINGILEHYESDNLADSLREDFEFNDLLEEIIDLLNINYDCTINLPEENVTLHCHRAALEQIFLNLLSNSLKYNEREKIEISVGCNTDDKFYNFSITDNGIGIPLDKQEEIFELFTVLTDKDRDGNRGNGIGLSTVKKLVTSLGGNINIHSYVNQGTTFSFSIKRSHLC